MHIKTRCGFCRAVDHLSVDADALAAYNAGQLVQDAFPTLSPSDRELIIAQRTGFYICPTCWETELTTEE